MATASVSMDQIGGAGVLEALFPDAIRNGAVDVVRMMRQCHYRAAAILEFTDGEREDTQAKRCAPDAIEAAKGYLDAAAHLAECLFDGADERVTLKKKSTRKS
jgi:hypothetical protein